MACEYPSCPPGASHRTSVLMRKDPRRSLRSLGMTSPVAAQAQRAVGICHKHPVMPRPKGPSGISPKNPWIIAVAFYKVRRLFCFFRKDSLRPLEKPSKILIICLGTGADLALTSSFCKALRELIPAPLNLHLLCSKESTALGQLIPQIDKVHSCPGVG